MSRWRNPREKAGVLAMYRRHLRPHRRRGGDSKRCSCPIWVQGTIGSEPIHKGLDLTSWETSAELLLRWEPRGGISGPAITVAGAAARFMDDSRAS